MALFTLHSFLTSLVRNPKVRKSASTWRPSPHVERSLHSSKWLSLMTIDCRLSEKCPAVVVRKRDSPQVIVVSRVRAQPIQSETRERAGMSPLLSRRRALPVIGKTAGLWTLIRHGISWYRRFPRKILSAGNTKASRSLSSLSHVLPFADSRVISRPLRKRGNKREKRRDPSRFMPDPAAPRRRICTGRTRP